MQNSKLMKQLGKLISLLMLLGVWLICSIVAAGELTADQEVQPSTAAVGETAMVSLMLTYSGNNGIQVTVTPEFTPGIAVGSGPQIELLSPGSQQMISYPIRAERSGSYWITSLISYTDEGAARQLSKESPFTVTGGSSGRDDQPGGDQSKPSDHEPSGPGQIPDQIPGKHKPGGSDTHPPSNGPEQPGGEPAGDSSTEGNGSA